MGGVKAIRHMNDDIQSLLNRQNLYVLTGKILGPYFTFFYYLLSLIVIPT